MNFIFLQWIQIYNRISVRIFTFQCSITNKYYNKKSSKFLLYPLHTYLKFY
nr:MAG TPA: hypothetical protein [Caudoviricetes sp.]